MTTITQHRMTTDEIALYRDVVRWCKAHDVFFQQHNGRWMEHTEYQPIRGPKVGRSVEIWHRDGVTWELGIDAHGGSRTAQPVWHKVTSVADAVDLLVHHKLLPPRFHSAYRAGWYACKVWEQHPATAPRGHNEEFERLFHAPENISFPAGTDL